MHKYEVIIYWSEEDQAYISEVPAELPGCMADGENYNEALQSVQTVINEWIETEKKLGRKIGRKLKYA